MLACCGQTDPREKAKWRAELCLRATYFPSHSALKLGVGEAHKGRGWWELSSQYRSSQRVGFPS